MPARSDTYLRGPPPDPLRSGACLIQHGIDQLERHLTGQLTQMVRSEHPTATATVTGRFLLSRDR